MFALSFFGIIHVPINVPALALSAKEDDVDINRELIAHGLSNSLSGFVGSIQVGLPRLGCTAMCCRLINAELPRVREQRHVHGSRRKQPYGRSLACCSHHRHLDGWSWSDRICSHYGCRHLDLLPRH